MKSLHLRIIGVVQGVGYRAGFSREAQRLGLAGWVRNCADGSVEAVISGEDDAVDRLMSWARVGPRSATVNQVSVSGTAPPTESHFRILA